MGRAAANEILAYWLLPAEPARSFFASTIAELASRFDAPPFEPHLTVYAGKQGDENPEKVLSRGLADLKPIRLSARDVEWSDEYTKTVFLEFEPSSALSRLSSCLQEASASPDEYDLNPHLSLIYKKMTRDEKVAVAAALRLPFTDVLFDSAKAIVCPAPITTREDVEAWRVVATQSLT